MGSSIAEFLRRVLYNKYNGISMGIALEPQIKKHATVRGHIVKSEEIPMKIAWLFRLCCRNLKYIHGNPKNTCANTTPEIIKFRSP